MGRKKMPSKVKINNYWNDKVNSFDSLEEIKKDPFLWKLALVDFGEASCWACGYYPNSVSQQKIAKANFLERCHIVPDMVGGHNSPDNFLLLCKECHKKSPDTKNPKWMKEWFVKKASFFKGEFDRMATLTEQEMKYALNNHDEFVDFLDENAGIHKANKHWISQTSICLVREFYEEAHNGTKD